MNNKPSYIFSADVIRSIAIIGVVIIHVVNAVYAREDFFGGLTWWFAIILDSFARISIPLFIMLSGYLLLGKDEPLEKSLKRIGYKILIPLAFWVPFYFWYAYGIPQIKFINLSILPKLFYSNVYHLYFLIIMIGLYFFAPLIRAYLKSVSTQSWDFLMKCFLVVGSTEIFFQFIFQACNTENFFTRWIPYTGLFIAGYVLGNKGQQYSRYKLFSIYAFTLALTLGFNYIHFYLVSNLHNGFSSAGCLSHYTDHYLSINVVAMSIAAFLLLHNFQYEKFKNNAIISTVVNSIARASFGIYLIHPFVGRFLEMQFNLTIDFSGLPIFLVIVSRLFLVFILSWIITLIAVRIPIVKLVFGETR